MFYYINMFFIGSFIGFVMETSIKYLFIPSLNNGLLYGPWIPVYGMGIVFAILIERFVFNRIKVNRWMKMFLTFILIVLLTTILEFLGGHLIEFLFHKTFWDYRKLKFNIGKYIALEISLLWGVLSMVFIYFIKPLIEKIINKIPRWISILACFGMLFDFILTLMKG